MIGLSDALTAYLFDSAVVAFGTAVENALQETIDVGTEDKPKREKKYTLKQLLTPGFTIETEEDDGFDVSMFKGMAGVMYDEVE